MIAAMTEQERDAVRLMAKGTEALTLFQLLEQSVSEFDTAKAQADSQYERAIAHAASRLSNQISGLVLAAQRRFAALEAGDDSDDNEE